MILPLLLVNVLLVSLTSCKEAKDAWNVDELFALGKKAYEEQDSQKALDYLQTAITWHKAVLNQRELCFNSCKGSKYTPSTPNYNNGEMHFFHSLNEFSRCMQQCKKSSKQHSSKSPASIPLHRRGFSSKINTTITNGDIHTYVQMALYEVYNIINFIIPPHILILVSDVLKFCKVFICLYIHCKTSFIQSKMMHYVPANIMFMCYLLYNV